MVRSCENMFKRLREVFEVLKEAKLTLKWCKCYFAYSEVAYLGYMLLADGILLGEQKVQAITISETKEQTRGAQVLGVMRILSSVHTTLFGHVQTR